MISVIRRPVLARLVGAVVICVGAAAAEDRFSPIFPQELQGKWKGEKDGTKVSLSFKDREARWTVEQKARKGRESIKAGPMDCVFVSKAGWVDLMLPVISTDQKGKASDQTDSVHVARLERERNGRFGLKIYPVAPYRPVEHLILRPDLTDKTPRPGK